MELGGVQIPGNVLAVHEDLAGLDKALVGILDILDILDSLGPVGNQGIWDNQDIWDSPDSADNLGIQDMDAPVESAGSDDL